MNDLFYMYSKQELSQKVGFLVFGDWLLLALSLVLAAICWQFFGRLGPKIVARLATMTRMSGQTEDLHLFRPVGLVAASTVMMLMCTGLQTPTELKSVLQMGFKTLCSLAWVALFWRVADILSELVIRRAQMSSNSFDELSATFTKMAVKILTVILGIVFISESFNLPLKSIVAGLGIGSLAFALAAKDTIENLFGSLTVLMDRPFVVGDFVVIDKAEGVVERIGFRSTKIRTPQNSLISLPNSKLITAIVDNLGQRKYRRMLVDLYVMPDTDISRVEEYRNAILTELNALPLVRQDSLAFCLKDIQLHGILLNLMLFIDTQNLKEEQSIKHQIISLLAQKAQEYQIVFKNS
jgi:MscS family membrane protein